jgi:cell division septation protein DedD
MAREENALALKGTLEAAGYPARIVRGAGVARRYKVYVGSYATKEEGEAAGRRLNVDGFPSTVARVGDRFSLEVGSFASEDDAIDLARELQVKNYPTKIGAQRGPSAIFHVRLGAFASLKDARKQGEELKAKGFTAVVVKQ